MKILHCCFSCFYIDGYNYQENLLVREGVRAGHDVLVFASTENFDVHGKLTYSSATQYRGGDGADVIRFPYRKIGPQALIKKIRAYSGVYKQMSLAKPDVILFHGLCAWELLTVLRYKKKNPELRLYLDSHEDFNNSARGFISKYILHNLFYRPIFRKSVKHAEKVLCISTETMDFVGDFYGCPPEKIEYFPLGGRIYKESEYQSIRKSVRKKYGLGENEILFLQSGKFDGKKKLVESLSSFLSLPYDSRIKYFVAGVFQDDVKLDVEELISKDDRIVFLGWKNSEELMHLLCATDIYVQPGSQSATLQNSICCRCAVIVDNVPSHLPFVKSNGWLVSGAEDLSHAFRDSIKIFSDGKLDKMQSESLRIAMQLLDYEKMAKRLMD